MRPSKLGILALFLAFASYGYAQLQATTSGSGSGGGTTTNALTMNNSNAGAASGSTFNGSAPITISSNTLGDPNLAANNSFTGNNLFTTTSAASTYGFNVACTAFSGGTGTTNFPCAAIIGNGATAPTSWDTTGTQFAVQGGSGIGTVASFRTSAGVTILALTSGNQVQVNSALLVGTFIGTKLGAAVASATTVTLTGVVNSVTGTNAITTMNIPSVCSATQACTVYLQAAAAWSATAGSGTGGFKTGFTAVANTMYICSSDASQLWWCK